MAFDIDWEALPYRRHPGVLIPILGRPYGEALQSGEIALRYDAADGSFAVWYFDHKLPINPQRYDEMLRTIVTAAGAHDDPAGHALIALADRLSRPERALLSRSAGAEAAASRHRGGAGGDRARALRPTATTAKPAPRRCIACSNGSITASPIGASRSRR